ncbi:L-xylo-3-hexulose reductase [Paramyrothecium foliicola]|nr:L-xylo-3-hexulose reductase [Paramyrothecium foliicola]
MQTYTVTEPFLDLKCRLAESPFWETKDNVLRFVDIENSLVYRVSLDKGPSSLQKLSYDDPVCVTADLQSTDDGFIFGGKYGIGLGKKESNDVRILQRYWSDDEDKDDKPKRMRANDGAVDSRGRFWVNTICDPQVTSSSGPEGALFRLDLDGSFHRVLSGLTAPNGMSWSKDNKIMYIADTSESSIFAYDFDEDSGALSNKRLFFKVEEEGAGPDGHTQDEHGNLWVAIWGGWRVVRVSPEGKVTGEIRLPTRCITAVALAGEDAYITSESDPEKDKYPDSARYHGGIGAAVVRRLAAKGCNLLLVFTSDSSKEPTEQLCKDLEATHNIHTGNVQADLSAPTDASPKIVEAARSLFQSYNKTGKFQIDILVNNAGVSSNQLMNDPEKGPIVEAEFNRVYAVNVLAPLLLTQAVAPHLPTDRSGRIVSVSSVSSSIGYQGQAVYAGTKAALEAMTRTWSRELASRATVNAVNPGPAWGDMYAEAGEKFWKINQPYVDAAPLAEYNGEDDVLAMAGSDAERFDKTVREGMGGRRPGFTSEIAGTIDMLCSAEGGWTTGSVICANGGMKMSIA